MSKDLYELLGVARDASPEDIKAAYRRAAMEHHPDRNPDDPDAHDRFQAVQQAYETLSDPDKRAFYDQHGSAPGPQMDPEAALREDAISIFMEAMNQSGPNPAQRDIIQLMEGVVMGKQMTLRQSLQQTESMIAKLEKVVGRIHRKEGAGPNVLSSFLEQDIAGKRQQCQRFRDMIDHGERLMEYIKTYTFDVEPAPQQWTSVVWNPTMSTGTAPIG